MTRWLLLLLFALLPARAAQQDTPVRLAIVEPASGAQVGGPEVRFRLTASGDNLPLNGDQWTGNGLFHVLLDGVDVLQVDQLQFSLIGVELGQHTVEVELQGWSGGASNRASTTIAVVPVARPDDTSWRDAPLVAAVAVLLLIGLLLLWVFWVRPQRLEPVYDSDDEYQDEGAAGRHDAAEQREG